MSGMTGRAKSNRKKSRGGDESGALPTAVDLADVAPMNTKNVVDEEMTEEDLQDQMVEQLAEKRSSTRMVALARLIDQLQTSVQYEFIADRYDTLTMYLLASIKKGDASEVALASRALSLVAVTLGTEAEKLMTEATPVLNEYMKNSSKSSIGRGAVAEALGFITFIAGNEHDTLAAMQLLTDQLKLASVPEALATGAWESFALLASTLPTHKLAGELLETHMSSLIQYLDHESVDVKTAAGECIALLWEAKRAIEAERAENDGNEEEDEGAAEEELDQLAPLPEAAIPTATPVTPATPDDAKMVDVNEATPASPAFSASTRSPAFQPRKRPHAKTRSSRAAPSATGAASSSKLGVDESSLVSKLTELVKDSGRYQSKKDRATQKKNFREFLSTVEDGTSPEESLKIEKSRHEFSGWAQIIQLDAVRDVIGKGLNAHFVHNEVCQAIFDLFIESGEGVDDPARKAASRAQSKAKAREEFESRAKQRKKKHAFMHAED